MWTYTTGATIVATLPARMASGRERFRRGWSRLIGGTERWRFPAGRAALLALLLMTASPQAPLAQLPGLTRARQSLDSAARAAAAAARPGADSAQEMMTTIDPIEIPLRATGAMVRIGEINAMLRFRGPVLDAQRSAEGLADSLRVLTGRQLAIHPAQVTRRAVSSLEAEWNRWDVRVQDWAGIIRRQVVQLDSLRDELDRSQQLWRRTITRARVDAVPAVIAEAEDVVRRLEDQRDAVKARQQELLATEVALTRADETIDAGLAAVDAAYANMRQQLFRIESPALWTDIAGGGWPSLSNTLGTRLRESVSTFAHFIVVHRGRVLLHLAITLVLFLTILNLHREVDRLAATNTVQVNPGSTVATKDHRWVLAHPRGASALMATLLTVVLYPSAPMIVYDVALLLSALSVWWLLPSLLPAGVVRPARWGFCLMAVDRLAVISLFATPWHRVVLLFLAIAGLLLAVRSRRQLRTLDETARQQPATRWAERGLSLAILLSVTSIPANLVGNVTLALVCASAVAVLASLAIVAVAGVTVINGVLALTVNALSDDVRILDRKGPQIVESLSRVVRAAAFAAWTATALATLLLWDPVRRLISDTLSSGVTMGSTELTIANVLLFFGVIWFGAMLGRWVALVLESDVLGRLSLPHGMSVTISSIVQYALTAIAFFLALAAAGVDVGQLTIIGGALSVGVGFGLQTIVNNFISGLILAFERPVSIGDTIQLGDLEGVVTKIGIRASVIRATTGAEVIVPNGRLLDRDLINWTRTDRSRRMDIPICLEFGSDPHAVVALLPAIAARHHDVSRAPAPTCLFQGHGSSGSDFVLRFWTEAWDHRNVASDIRLAVHEALTKEGYSSPFPQHDLHLRSVSADVMAALAGATEPPGPSPDHARHASPS